MSRRFKIEPEGFPDLASMMLATVEALKTLGGSAKIQELDEAVAELEGEASDEATRDGATAIDLIDGGRLCELLKENGLGVTTQMIESTTIDAKWLHSI